MKPVHIVILIAVSVGLAIAVSFYGDTSQYVCFSEADSIAQVKPNMKLHVVTTLSKDKPELYDAQNDPNYFEFYAKDTSGVEKRVVYRNSKPQDMDKTDKVVLIGYSKGDYFEAKDILKKCPSKYEKK
jgi:cytochrome c-type biogenesis protein CcmE